MKSTAFAVGITVALFLVVALFKFMNRDKKLKTEYDERQKGVRGKAYMFGFFGMLFGNCIMLLISTDNMEFIHILGMNTFFIPILIGIIMQFSYSVFNDGYIGLNNNLVRFIICMSLISVFNFAAGIVPWVKDGFIQNGTIYTTFPSLLVGIMFVILCIELAIKKLMDKKRGE